MDEWIRAVYTAVDDPDTPAYEHAENLGQTLASLED